MTLKDYLKSVGLEPKDCATEFVVTVRDVRQSQASEKTDYLCVLAPTREFYCADVMSAMPINGQHLELVDDKEV